MTKSRFIYKHKATSHKAEGSIRVGDPSPEFVEFLTRSVPKKKAALAAASEDIDWQIAKTLVENKDEGAALKADWRIFLQSKANAPRFAAVRTFERTKVGGGVTTEEALRIIHNRDCRSFCDQVAIVPHEDLPYHITGQPDHGFCLDPNCHDRYFRDAVRFDNGAPAKCGFDMPVAKGIHMAAIRSSRDKALASLDVPFMRAVEAGDTAEQQLIAAQKQVLRDIPQTFDLSKYRTPETLKAAWPETIPKLGAL